MEVKKRQSKNVNKRHSGWLKYCTYLGRRAEIQIVGKGPQNEIYVKIMVWSAVEFFISNFPDHRIDENSTICQI